MTEILNVSIAVVLSICLHNIYTSKEEDSITKKVFIYVFLILIATLFRQTHVFFILGILPLIKDKKSFFIYGGMVLLGVFYALKSYNLLVAEYYGAPLDRLSQQPTIAAKLNFVWELTKGNFAKYFGHNKSYPQYYFIYKYVLVFISALHGYYYLKTKNKSSLAVFFICMAHLGTLLTIYDASDWREHRPLAAVFMVSAIFFVLNNQRIVQYALVGIAIYSIPEMNKLVKEYDKARIDYAEFEKTQTQAKDFFNTIKEYKTEKDIVTVQLPPNMGFNYFYMMPLKSNEGKPIRYNLTLNRAAPEKSTFITNYLKLP